MHLRIRSLQIRIQTENEIYGCDISFGNGLVLLRADNTKGKSTCLMSILYALGLEGMLGPSHSPPLPPVMLEQLTTRDGTCRVIDSFVTVEIEGIDSTVTVTRRVAGSTLQREKITVTFGPALTAPAGNYETKDYLVRTKHAAQGEAGFHTFFAKFVGWELPHILRFDGERTILYVECLAPYFFVDQLSGWRDVKARMPTYLQIPDMAKRSAEYILSLDVLRIAIARFELKKQEDQLHRRWADALSHFRAAVPRVGVVLRGIPTDLAGSDTERFSPELLISQNDGWEKITDHVQQIRSRIDALRQQEVPTTKQVAPEAVARLEQLDRHLADTQRKFEGQLVEIELGRQQLRSVSSRLANLREDARQYEDDYRLRARGGKGRLKTAEDTCPTCGQHIEGVLLPANSSVRAMPLEENRAFIRDQIKTFRELEADIVRSLEGKEQAIVASKSQLSELVSLLHAQKALIRADADAPSVANIQERLVLEARLERISEADELFSHLVAQMKQIYEEWQSLRKQKVALGNERLTDVDMGKILNLGHLFVVSVPRTCDVSFVPVVHGPSIGQELIDSADRRGG